MTVRYSKQQLGQFGANVGGAVNLPGILRTWVEVQDSIRFHWPNKGHEFYNSHPVNVLFADAVSILTRLPIAHTIDAYRLCDRAANGDESAFDETP